MVQYELEDDTREKKQELLDFANMVFSMSAGAIDFEDLLPKAYREDVEGRIYHHVLRENGKVKALIDVNPGFMDNGIRTLQTGYIGTVSVHPKARKKGYMIALMDRVETFEKDRNTDVILLDGARARYQAFGYEKAGAKINFHFDSSALRHFDQNLVNGKTDFSFEEIDPDDEALLHQLYDLYCNKNVISRKKEDFFDILCSWNARNIAIFCENRCYGYVNMSEDMDHIFEMVLAEDTHIMETVCALNQEYELEDFVITVGMDEVALIEALSGYCAYWDTNLSHQIKILQFENVVTFLLEWKSCYTVLEKGKWKIGMQKEDGVIYYEIAVGQEIRVKKINEKADCVVSEMEFVQYFLTDLYHQPFVQHKLGSQKAPEGWFPLPFYLPEADAF